MEDNNIAGKERNCPKLPLERGGEFYAPISREL
jgi:hypothetical protein